MKTLLSINEIKMNVKNNDIYVVVFATKSCNVCKPLKVKLEKALEKYEQVSIDEVYIDDIEEAMGTYQVYTAPITLLFIQGQESKRYSAAMDIHEFKSTIHRYVGLMF
jgi:thiol-disulfide isomerase/thioredoxin